MSYRLFRLPREISRITSNYARLCIFSRESLQSGQLHDKASLRRASDIYFSEPGSSSGGAVRHSLSFPSENDNNGSHDGGKQDGGLYIGSIVLGLGVAFVLTSNSKEALCEGEPFTEVTDTRGAKKTISEAINDATDLAYRLKEVVGSPGLVIAVNVNGKEVWSEGLGYADIENGVPCQPRTVIRIASISKSMTMTIAGRLMEQGKLDVDKDVKTYVKDWPQKHWDGKKVDMTTRQLVSHMAGVRHYSKACAELKANDDQDKKKEEEQKPRPEPKEFFFKRNYPNVSAALKMFKDDPLCYEPGSNFLYTTHGWTLVSAVLEGAAGKPFTQLAQDLFYDLGLSNTYLDEPTPIIYNRASNYVKNNQGRLVNAPYVDNSYKWAGGGFLSTMGDLCRFGDAMLYSLQHDGGYLQRETMREMWEPVPDAPCGWDRDGKYAMGWCSIPAADPPVGRRVRHYVSHTGGAVGASSVLLVMPRPVDDDGKNGPQGITVAIAVNMQGVGLNKLALQIAKIFEETLE